MGEAFYIYGDNLLNMALAYEKAQTNLEECDSMDLFLEAHFTGYVIACTESIGHKIKIPEDVTLVQIFTKVASYIKNHPELLGNNAYSVVCEALMDSFPR